MVERTVIKANVRPKPVRAGVMIFYAALGLAGVRSILEAANTAKLLGSGFMILMTVIIVVALGVMSFVIAMMGRGRNWARITVLVLFLFSLSTSLLPLLHSFPLRPISGVLGLAQFFLQFVALIFLFQKKASAWFRARNHMVSSASENYEKPAS